MPQKKILIVHPYDRTTLFLERIHNNLLACFENDIQYFKIETNDSSHNQCLTRINDHSSKGMIIFLGHGRSDALYGSKGDEFSPSVGYEEIANFPDLYYFKENFISKKNADVFSGKKVFCLACKSNDKIAEYAMEKGATTFFGFGNIPTSRDEFRVDGLPNASIDIVSAMKTELNYVIYKSIEYSLLRAFNFEQLQNIIHFIINQKITDYLITKKDFIDRHILADYLYKLKKKL